MHYESSPSLETMKVYTFVDPAISQKQEADYTAIITIGIDQNNRIYVLDIFHERVEPSDSINALFEIVKQYRPERV
jgi:phage terminase large subunit-like protein